MRKEAEHVLPVVFLFFFCNDLSPILQSVSLVLATLCLFRYYHALVWTVSAIMTIVPYVLKSYGPAGPWWWVINRHSKWFEQPQPFRYSEFQRRGLCVDHLPNDIMMDNWVNNLQFLTRVRKVKNCLFDQSKTKRCTKKSEYFGVTTPSKADVEQVVGWYAINFNKQFLNIMKHVRTPFPTIPALNSIEHSGGLVEKADKTRSKV